MMKFKLTHISVILNESYFTKFIRAKAMTNMKLQQN